MVIRAEMEMEEREEERKETINMQRGKHKRRRVRKEGDLSKKEIRRRMWGRSR